MPESGDPTTQSGIRYQNTVAALYLVQMCGQCSSPDQIEALQAEAPDHVDDLVVTFTGGRRVWVHVKENVRKSEAAWDALWCDFGRQFQEVGFRQRRDGMMLYAGTSHDDLKELREMCERAKGYEEESQWLKCLNRRQASLLGAIRAALSRGLGKGDALAPNVHDLMRHITVTIATVDEVEQRAEHLVPPGGIPPSVLVSFLRDRVGAYARYRVQIGRATLMDEVLWFSRLLNTHDHSHNKWASDSGGRIEMVEIRLPSSAEGAGRRRLLRDMVSWCGCVALLSGAIAFTLSRCTTNHLAILVSSLIAMGCVGILLQIGVGQLDRWAKRKLRQKYDLEQI